MALDKVVYQNGVTIIGADNLNAIQDEIIRTAAYGSCTTAAGTAAKVAGLVGTAFGGPAFSLAKGAKVSVYFTNSNTANNPTLNVENTGAKTIRLYGSTNAGTTEATSWKAGELVDFVYDGTYWRIVGKPIGNVANLNYTVVSEF